MTTFDGDDVDLTKLSPAQLKQHVQTLNDQIKSQQELIKKLRFDLDMEQGKVNILRHDCQALKQLTVDLQATAEQEEEYISNTLLKRIESLKKEKGELLIQVEREEEYLTNNLQRRLEKLQREKIEMENALEQEQEAIVNKLQKQLEFLSQQQSSPAAMASSLSSDTPFGNGSVIPTAPPPKETVLEILRSEIHALRIKQGELEKEVIAKYNQALAYKKELVELRRSTGLPVEDLIGDDDPPSIMRCSPIPRPRVMSASSFSVTSGQGHRSRSASASSFSSGPSRSRALSFSEPQSPFSHVPVLAKPGTMADNNTNNTTT